MLKFIFWTLLALNAAFFAYGQGYLGKWNGNEHEPARMKNQLNAAKLILVSPASASAAADKARADAAEENRKQSLIACTEIGAFDAAGAKKFESLLAPFAFGERESKQTIAAQEVTQHMVYIPPQGSKEAADKKAEELKALGVNNYFIISDASNMKWAISLGVFKSEAAAQTLLAALQKQGVRTARISGRGPTTSKFAFQVRDIDADTRTKLDKLHTSFAGTEIHDCKS